MFIRKLVLGLVLFIFAITCKCVAPMSRSSLIKTKDHVEIGGGSILFKSVVLGEDTTSWWGGRLEEATYVGLQGNLRLGFGFSAHFGIDYTLSILTGIPLNKGEGFEDFAVWPHSSLNFKLRPWQSNNLFLLGIQSPGILSAGWVHGWPSYGREKYSSMIEVGNLIPAAIANEWSGEDFKEALLPSVILFTFARNFYFNSKRLSPNIAIGIAWDWEENALETWSIMFGLNWAP